MNFQAFQKLAKDSGLDARDCGNGHWQVIGGALVVNFWPCAKGGSKYHAAGMGKSKHGEPRDAIAAAGVDAGRVPEGEWITKERFAKALKAREAAERLEAEQQKRRDEMRRLPRDVRAQLATDHFGDMPDGAFFAASEEVFGVEPGDFQ